MTTREAVITGTGIISSLGNDVDTYFKRLVAGEVGLKRATHPTPEDSPPSFYAEVPDFVASDWMSDKIIDGTDRFAQFALAASEQALRSAGLQELDPLRTGIAIGTSMGGTRALTQAQHLFETEGAKAVPRKVMIQIWPNMAAAQIAMRHGIHGPSITLCTACASSIDAIGNATRMIQTGQADVVITGGTEASGDIDFTPATSAAQRGYGMSAPVDDPRLACRPFDRDRAGMASGEGSGMLVLEAREHAEARGATILGVVRGYASLADAYHPSSPDPSGEWEALVMRRALDDSGVSTKDIPAIYAHGTGTKVGDSAEIRAINAVYEGFTDDLLVTSLKGGIGHTGGAAAAMNLVAALEGMHRDAVAPVATTTVVDPEADFQVVLGGPAPAQIGAMQLNAFGFGGQNASLVVSAP